MPEVQTLPAELAPLPAAASRRFQRLRAMWLLPVAAVLLPLVTLGTGGWLAWESSWREARSELGRSASAAAEYATRTLDGYVVATGRIDDLIRGLPDAGITAREQALHAALAAMIPELPQAAGAFVTDASGTPLLAANLYPVPRDRPTAADRDFFLALGGARPPPVHLSRVYVSRFDDQPFFAISRRRSGEGFRGIVNVSVDPQMVSAALARLLDAPEDRISLLRNDGEVLARTGATAWPQPGLAPDGAFHRAVAEGAFAAVYAMPARPDDPTKGAARLVALRRLDGYPAYAAVSRPRAAIVADWRRTMAGHLWFGVPATLALLALALRVVQTQRKLIAANAGLQSNLAETTARLVRAQEAAGVQSWALGPDGRIEADAGLPALLGAAAGSPLDRGALLGCLHPEDRARLAAELQRLLARGGALNQEVRVARPGGARAGCCCAARRCPRRAACRAGWSASRSTSPRARTPSCRSPRARSGCAWRRRPAASAASNGSSTPGSCTGRRGASSCSVSIPTGPSRTTRRSRRAGTRRTAPGSPPPWRSPRPPGRSMSSTASCARGRVAAPTRPGSRRAAACCPGGG